MKQKSLKLNFIMNAVLTMSSFLFPLITFPYISRVLLPDGVGKVSFATSLINYFGMFAQLGIPVYGIRACAKVRDDKEELTRTAHELLFINLLMNVVTYAALFISLFTVPRLREDRTLYVIVSLAIILTSVGMEWLYKALEQYTYITIRSIVFKFLALIAMFMLVHTTGDYVIYGAISIFAASASNILNLINAHKYIGMKPVGNYHPTRHLKMVFVFFAMSCATTVYTNLDTVMLGFMTSDADVGYYNAAVKIKVILVSVVTSLGTVLLPRASYYIEQGKLKEFKRISGKAIHFIFLIAAPMLLYFVLYAKESIYFLSGAAFEGSIAPMQIIMPTLLFIGLSNILGIQILVPMGKEKVVLFSEIAGAVTDLILNYLFIPGYKAAGAAFATVIAEFVVLLVQFLYLRKEVFSAFRVIDYWKILGGMLAGAVLCIWVKRLPVGSFVTLVISACVFFSAYGLVLLMTGEDLTVEIVMDFWKNIQRKIFKNK